MVSRPINNEESCLNFSKKTYFFLDSAFRWCFLTKKSPFKKLKRTSK